MCYFLDHEGCGILRDHSAKKQHGLLWPLTEKIGFSTPFSRSIVYLVMLEVQFNVLAMHDAAPCSSHLPNLASVSAVSLHFHGNL